MNNGEGTVFSPKIASHENGRIDCGRGSSYSGGSGPDDAGFGESWVPTGGGSFDCFNRQVYQYITDKDLKYCFKIGGETPGGFQESTGSIFFRDIHSINNNVFSEEFFHAYQSSFYEGLPTNQGRSNIEFEAKLFYDLTHNGNCCIVFQNPDLVTEYFFWLAEITNDLMSLPTWNDLSSVMIL